MRLSLLHATRFAAATASQALASPLGDPAPLFANLLAAATLLVISLIIIGLMWFDVRRSSERVAIYLTFRAIWLFSKLWHGVRHRGSDPLPPTGPIILISNHTSPADPFFLQSATPRVISFMMAREYADIRGLQWLFRLGNTILVNRTGRDTAATKAAIRALRAGAVVGIFPEGGIHLDANTVGKAKPGAAMLALLTRVPVIPAFVDRPVHTNQLLQGVASPASARVFFGRPIDLSGYHERGHDEALLRELSERLMAEIEKLRPPAARTN